MIRVCDKGHLNGGASGATPLAKQPMPKWYPRSHPGMQALRRLRASTRGIQRPLTGYPKQPVVP